MDTNNKLIENNIGFSLFWYTESNKQLLKVAYPKWRILILKKDVIKIIWINRKTLNTLIKRWKQNIFVKKLNWEIYLDLSEMLLYLNRHNKRWSPIR